MRDLGDELLQAKVKATLFGGDHAPRLGRLLILDRLGRGAMGTVFRAYDPGLDRTVAVKLVHAGAATAREARALGKLHHPNVVAVHDVGELDGAVYIVMELAPGVPLRTWIAGDRTWRDVVRVMSEAAAGLAAAHRAGLVHRDIKPDNIIVGDDRTRVVDLGLAQDADSSAERGAGTPSYMAPEALDGEPASAASDQFSFGVTLYEALYGVRPHTGKSRDELRDAARTAAAAKPSRSATDDIDASADTAPAPDGESDTPPPDADRSSGGTARVRSGRPVRDAPPGWVHAIATRALAADPAKRFASMDELAAALGRDRRRRRVLAGAVAGATIAGALVGAVAYRHGASPADVCAGGPERRAAVWSPTASDRVRAQLAAAPWGPRVVTALDATAHAWEASYRTVCEASRVKGGQSDTLLDLRMRCLDRALDRFGALAEALAAPLDAQGRAEATGAVADLPRPEVCETMTEPGELALPTDPAARARATSAEHAIDRAWAAYSLGRYRDAAAALGTLPADGQTLGAPGVDAAALLARAAVEARIGKPHTARALLEQALAAAARAHAVELEAEVWARLLRHELFAGQPAHAVEWAPFALAAAARANRDGAEIEGIVGEALRDSGRYAEARTRLARALASKDALRGDRRALILVNIGSIELALGAPAAAESRFREALAAATEQLGEGHPTLAIYYDKLAAAARAQGRIADALALNEKSLAVRTAAYGADDRSTASSYLGRARTLLEAKRLDEAFADAQHARAIRSSQLGETSVRLGEVDALLGDIELARGDKREALDRFELAAMLDPRLDLIARRAAAGHEFSIDELPSEIDPLTADRAAALALRIARSSPPQAGALAQQLLDRYRALPRPVDPALVKAIGEAVRIAGVAGAEDVH